MTNPTIQSNNKGSEGVTDKVGQLLDFGPKKSSYFGESTQLPGLDAFGNVSKWNILGQNHKQIMAPILCKSNNELSVNQLWLDPGFKISLFDKKVNVIFITALVFAAAFKHLVLLFHFEVSFPNFSHLDNRHSVLDLCG